MTTPLPSPTHTLNPWIDRITHGDCLDVMSQMPTGQVDLILADLPYGTTRNKWDSIIDLDAMWTTFQHVIKPNGAIVLTAAQPFTSQLVISNPKWFRYEWIWAKPIGSGQLNIHRRPLNTHESVLVFYKHTPTYNAQMTQGEPYRVKRKASGYSGNYGAQRDHETVSDKRYPKTVLQIPNPRHKDGHPTQKPVALFEYLIRTYTRPGDVVLDPVIGSGTTAEAALRTQRRFIGIEKDPHWADRATERANTTRAAIAGPPEPVPGPASHSSDDALCQAAPATPNTP